MKITIYTNKEKTEKIYDMELADYLIITANELWGKHWQVIEYGNIVISKEAAECS
jgi:hypothetical protein